MITPFFQDRPVLVTGATGFVGRWLAAALQAHGARLRLLARSGGGLISSSVETVIGDLTDPASLARACAGMDTVIHAAGYAHAGSAATPEQVARHWAVNAEGSAHLLTAAVAAGVQRYVFLSSVKAAGAPDPHCVDESWDAPPETPYGQAKRAAEARALAVGQETGLHVVNLRLALVYGPGLKGNLARLARLARCRLCPAWPDTGSRRSLVHGADVAQAALRAAANPAAWGQTYLVTDGQRYASRELLLLLRQAQGRSAPRWTMPAPWWWRMAGLADGALGLTGHRGRPMHTALEQVLGWACYDASRIMGELGYRPEWTFQRFCTTGWDGC